MNFNIKKIGVLVFLATSCFAQKKADEWNLTANSRQNYFSVAMANGQIGIVTNDEPLKTKEIILNGVYQPSPENSNSNNVLGIKFLNLYLANKF